MCSKRTEVEDEDYDHGYHIHGCNVCGWLGWTDTGNCEECVICVHCDQPHTDVVPCKCEDEDEDVKLSNS